MSEACLSELCLLPDTAALLYTPGAASRSYADMTLLIDRRPGKSQRDEGQKAYLICPFYRAQMVPLKGQYRLLKGDMYQF